MQKEFLIPDELLAALENDKTAKDVFEKLSFSHQKEYVNYILEAKKTETRMRRAEKTILMLNKK